jgi:hypothetical protein
MAAHPAGGSLEIVRDLRTALKENPLPLDVLEELLGEAA